MKESRLAKILLAGVTATGIHGAVSGYDTKAGVEQAALMALTSTTPSVVQCDHDLFGDLNRDGTVDDLDSDILDAQKGNTDPNIVPVYDLSQGGYVGDNVTYRIMNDLIVGSDNKYLPFLGNNIVVDFNHKTITGNGVIPIIEIAWGSSNITLKNGILTNGGTSCIYGENSNSIVLENLVIKDTIETGIAFYDMNDVSLKDVSVINSGDYGVRFLRSDNLNLDNVVIENSVETGLRIDGQQNKHFKNISANNVTITGSGEYGLEINDMDNGNIAGLSVTNSGEDGIKIIDCRNFDYSDVLAENNGWGDPQDQKDGIDLTRSENINFESLTLLNSADDGYDFTNSTGSIRNSYLEGRVKLEGTPGKSKVYVIDSLPYDLSTRTNTNLLTRLSSVDLNIVDPNNNPLPYANIEIYNLKNVNNDPNQMGDLEIKTRSDDQGIVAPIELQWYADQRALINYDGMRKIEISKDGYQTQEFVYEPNAPLNATITLDPTETASE